MGWLSRAGWWRFRIRGYAFGFLVSGLRVEVFSFGNMRLGFWSRDYALRFRAEICVRVSDLGIMRLGFGFRDYAFGF